MKVGIIGMGNMGAKYALMIAKGDVKGMELAAITRVTDERWDMIRQYVSPELMKFNSGDDMYAAIDDNSLSVDAVIIVTPHYSHEELVKKAFERGISVLCDKPAGVYSRQARSMWEAYQSAKKSCPKLQYGFIFHQRTFPVYRKIKEIIDNKTYGNIKRVNWVITDWYRPDAYYESGKWRATWKYDGGGTLLNQCPHNLDLLSWICGNPSDVAGFCSEGKYHPIEVEDDVTAYMEWENGASGVFIASTGEAPGVNRLEISLDNALLVCDKGQLRVCELDKPEIEYRRGNGDLFAKPKYEWKDIKTEPNDGAYEKLLTEYAAGRCVANGDEAINSLYLSNAIYLSSWKNRKVALPVSGSRYELMFEKQFEKELEKAVKELERTLKKENTTDNAVSFTMDTADGKQVKCSLSEYDESPATDIIENQLREVLGENEYDKSAQVSAILKILGEIVG